MSSDTIASIYDVCSTVSSTSFVAGVELEVESISGLGNLPAGWNVTEDGSLRNEGREFVSPPLSRHALETHFQMIHTTIKHYKQWPAFSDRTSIHVHVNCLQLAPEQVKSIVMWYAMFEPLFFSMCAPHRRNNIHCVGLDQTVLSENFKRSVPVMVQKWSKYTALNLLPLKTQGTIEFRHMEGHSDKELFAKWLRTIENLWAYGQKTILDKTTVDEGSIKAAFDTIFADSGLLGLKGSLMEIIADNIIDIKLSLV